MGNVHTKAPNRAVNRRRSAKKQAYESRDYFGEALRILDHDMTLEPQREHLVTLWGLVTGLTRRLTQATVGCQDCRNTVIRAEYLTRATIPTDEQIASTC
ncbi:hypothetical protein [Candidatus Methylomirabilis sp.]|uniref:hypothetical protein n=1 Tax=Candidatus Methylomirabilis sp. TaxID=2032687 RepID=UPI0030760BEC